MKKYEKTVKRLSNALKALGPVPSLPTAKKQRSVLHLGHDVLYKAKQILEIQERIHQKKSHIALTSVMLKTERKYLKKLEQEYLELDAQMSNALWAVIDGGGA